MKNMRTMFESNSVHDQVGVMDKEMNESAVSMHKNALG